MGAAIGFASRHWAWRVAVSLPIGYLSSIIHATPDGILASQSIDFPPVLLATFAGLRAREEISAFTRATDCYRLIEDSHLDGFVAVGVFLADMPENRTAEVGVGSRVPDR